MKSVSIILFFICFESTNSFGQTRDFISATTDSIFYLGDHHFKYRELDYNSIRALKKVLALDPYSDLYVSSQQFMKTRRWATALEIFGIGSAVVAPLDGFGVSEGYVHPVPLLVGLVSIGGSLLLWKKSRKQLRNFVDEYNHAVYDRYIQQKYMSSIVPTSPINIGFTIKF